MIETVIFLILIGLYIFNTICAYKCTNVMYSEGGRWENLIPDGDDLFLTFMPLVNCISAMDYLLGNCYGDKEKHILNKFYRIHK